MAAGHVKRRAHVVPVEHLDAGRFLPFVPQNENGVVYVFALVAKRLGFEVHEVQAAFPDCVATWGGRRTRIEFEYRSSNFERHGHTAKRCDLIVCWKHDWARAPAGLAVLELRKVFGLAREVFVVAYRDEFWRRLPQDRQPTGLWSVPSSAGPDDVLLVYRPATATEEGSVTDIFRVDTPPERVGRPRFRDEPDWMASIQRVAKLGNPIPFSRLREVGAHGGIESRPRRTSQWPTLHRLILEEGAPSHSLKRLSVL